MVVGADGIVALGEAIVERQIASPRLEKSGARTVKVREDVLNGVGRGGYNAGVGVQARQLRAKRVNLCGPQEHTRVHHTVTDSGARDGSGRLSGARVSRCVTDGLEINEPEEFVLDNGSPHRPAKLLQICRRDLP